MYKMLHITRLTRAASFTEEIPDSGCIVLYSKDAIVTGAATATTPFFTAAGANGFVALNIVFTRVCSWCIWRGREARALEAATLVTPIRGAIPKPWTELVVAHNTTKSRKNVIMMLLAFLRWKTPTGGKIESKDD